MSSLTTCQALIILAYREFGLGTVSWPPTSWQVLIAVPKGSFEQASLFIGESFPWESFFLSYCSCQVRYCHKNGELRIRYLKDYSQLLLQAQDLGLHRAADRWQRFGRDIFSEEQKRERKHVWWACNIEEKCVYGIPSPDSTY